MICCRHCGKFLIRRSNRQEFCDSEECQRARNARKQMAYRKRKAGNASERSVKQTRQIRSSGHIWIISAKRYRQEIQTAIISDSPKNDLSEEEIWKMELSVCDMIIELCINTDTLIGEPAVGRRFRGLVWLQGELCL